MNETDKTVGKSTEQALQMTLPAQEVQLKSSINPMYDYESYQQGVVMAKAMASSNIVPADYRGREGIANCVMAMVYASRLRVDPFTVAQNLYPIKGKLMWSSAFAGGLINSSKRFTLLIYDISGEGDDRGCQVVTVLRETRQEIRGPRVTVRMAKKDGWYGRNKDKWEALTDQMLCYRALSFFGKLYAADILSGLSTMEADDQLEELQSTTDKINAVLDAKFVPEPQDQAQAQAEPEAEKKPEAPVVDANFDEESPSLDAVSNGDTNDIPF